MKIISIKPEETWPIRHQVMWPDHPLSFVKILEDSSGDHYGLIVNKKLVSIISLFYQGDKAQFRKFATLVEEQGKGYGSYLLNHIMDIVSQKPIKELWCNARIDKSDYYERFGLLKTSKTYIKGGIDFIIMSKSI